MVQEVMRGRRAFRVSRVFAGMWAPKVIRAVRVLRETSVHKVRQVRRVLWVRQAPREMQVLRDQGGFLALQALQVRRVPWVLRV